MSARRTNTTRTAAYVGVDGKHDQVTESFVSPRAATIHEVTENHTIMTWDRCLGVVWKRETTLPGVETFTRVYREHIQRFPEGIYLMSIVEPGSSMPSYEVREAVAVFLRAGTGRIRMSAMVHEGDGFQAAAVRSVVTGIAMLSRLPYPHHVFATVEQAAKWLGTTRYRDVDPDYTVRAVEDARLAAAVEMRQRMSMDESGSR